MKDDYKRGPISLKNYDMRMQAHGLVKGWGDEWPFLSHSHDYEPTADEVRWERYFREHLGGYPKTFQLWRSGKITYLNMPEALPEQFDTSYKPDHATERGKPPAGS